MLRRSLPILQQDTVGVDHPVTHQHFTLLKGTYGALTEDLTDPLSAVSVANSSLSIDLWKGCAWQCAYCHVQGSNRNLSAEGIMPKQVTRVGEFSIEEILVALQSHPFFVDHQTVLSIGTASTEPLAHGSVEDSTFRVLEVLQNMGLRNPVWIVTKNYVSEKRVVAIKAFCDSGSKLMISPTINGLDSRIEPLHNNRTKNWRKVAEAGANVVLYLRPLVRAWGSSEAKVTATLEAFRAEMGTARLSAIVPGGLRWTEGIDYGLQVRGLEWPDGLPRIDNEKDLDDKLWDHIVRESARFFPGVPVVHHSSCALSNVLTRSDLSQVFSRSPVACGESTCGESQRYACTRAKQDLESNRDVHTRAAIEDLQLDAACDLPYALKRSLLKAIANKVEVKY